MSIVMSRRYKKESPRDSYSESPQTTRPTQPTSSPPFSPPPFITPPSDPESEDELREPIPTHTGTPSPFDDPTTTLGNASSGAGSADSPKQDSQLSKAEIEPTPGQEQPPPMQPPSTTTAGTPQAGWISPFNSPPQMPSAPLPRSTTPPAAPEKPPRTLVLCFDGTGDSFDKDVCFLLSKYTLV